MRMKLLLRAVEKELRRFVDKLEPMGDPPDATGGAWSFEMEKGDLSGYVSCEDRREDVGFATVSVGIYLDDVTTWSRDDILELLEINAEIGTASLNVVRSDDEHRLLFIAETLPASDFEPKELRGIVDWLAWMGDRVLPVEGEEGEAAAAAPGEAAAAATPAAGGEGAAGPGSDEPADEPATAGDDDEDDEDDEDEDDDDGDPDGEDPDDDDIPLRERGRRGRVTH